MVLRKIVGRKKTKTMAKHNDLGEKGEAIAVRFLQKKGLSILETNWRYKKAEIDIIAKNEEENILILVEVKTRSSNYFGEPEEFVTVKKEKMMADAAVVYAESIGHDWEIRFDVMGIILGKESIEINHLEDAFFPYDFD